MQIAVVVALLTIYFNTYPDVVLSIDEIFDEEVILLDLTPTYKLPLNVEIPRIEEKED